MKSVEIPGEAPAEIRGEEGIAAATTARANLRRVHEKSVSPVGIASGHRSPKSNGPNKATKLLRLLDRLLDQ
jgi:hypothetical protein